MLIVNPALPSSAMKAGINIVLTRWKNSFNSSKSFDSTLNRDILWMPLYHCPFSLCRSEIQLKCWPPKNKVITSNIIGKGKNLRNQKKNTKNQYMDSHLMTICKCGLSKINVGRRENINKNDYPCRVSQISWAFLLIFSRRPTLILTS
jgi:hypothetical protein